MNLPQETKKLNRFILYLPLDEIEEISEALQGYKDLPDVGDGLSAILKSVFLSKYKQAIAQIDEMAFDAYITSYNI
ncbi:MAG: hypothetical protein FWC16_10505 [Defluviitaleaceae bacterium]|nr:hypothetical protein [Defluviitaleaceae bacterium]MCL2275347.1 hypothetical protein [Defluviitaleaceae bacterium]